MWIQIDNDACSSLSILLKGSDSSEVRALGEKIDERWQEGLTPEWKRFREAADEQASDGRLEVDEDAVVSMGSDAGAYVMAWLWVTNQAAGVTEEEDDEVADAT